MRYCHGSYPELVLLRKDCHICLETLSYIKDSSNANEKSRSDTK